MHDSDVSRTLFHLNAASLALYLIFFILIVLYCFLTRKNRAWLEFKGRRVLLITAHPDDECMFFGPVISHACRVSSSFSLLCLTNGNYENRGEERKRELLKSCKILGIKNVTTLDNKLLVDDPDVIWNESLVGDILLQHINTHKINSIITFDSYGVSGHNNHISIYKAIKKVIDQRSLPHAVAVYTLDSVMLLRKYVFILDLLWSFLTRRLIFVSNANTIWKCQKAMAAHETQYVWYRRLYVIFSRYMVVNTLTQIWGYSYSCRYW